MALGRQQPPSLLTPTLTWGHLRFAGITTAYIVVDVLLQQRELRRAFGEPYERFRREVSMVVPWVGKRHPS